jgi:hypothetical protein
MKKIILGIMLIVSFAITGITQELNTNAKMIKEKFNYEYENNFKSFAVKEWKDDFAMVVYEINRQSDSYFEMMNKLKSEYSSIFFNALNEWAREGYKEENLRKIREDFKPASINNFIKLKVDWSMVKYEYDRQVKAKESF